MENKKPVSSTLKKMKVGESENFAADPQCIRTTCYILKKSGFGTFKTKTLGELVKVTKTS